MRVFFDFTFIYSYYKAIKIAAVFKHFIFACSSPSKVLCL